MKNDSDDANATLRHTIKTYNQVAGDYVARSQRNGRWKTVFPELLQFMDQLPATARVLDLGCGPGHHTELLNGHHFRAIGADLSWGMLSQARELVTGEFIQADMRFLPLPNGYFDGVWMSASLLHLPRRDAPIALKEVHRILQGGGIFNVIVKIGEGEGLRTNLGERYFTFYGVDEMLTLLETSGFGVQHHQIKQDGGFDPWLNVIATKI
jgi:ubiquinone/menaquinone biosynthesis C-methylase UbiE